MTIAVIFTPPSMTAAQYDTIIQRLEQAGAGAPEGRLYHACYGSGDQMRVTDIWTSEETFQRFGQVLIPVLQQLGVDPGQPQILPIHNII